MLQSLYFPQNAIYVIFFFSANSACFINCALQFNPLMPELNPSEHRCLPGFFTGEFKFYHFMRGVVIGVQFHSLPPGSTAASVAYCTIPCFSKRSYSGRQESLAPTTRGSPLVVRGGTMGEKWWPNGDWDIHPGFFYMPQICDMGPIILLPFRRKAC